MKFLVNCDLVCVNLKTNKLVPNVLHNQYFSLFFDFASSVRSGAKFTEVFHTALSCWSCPNDAEWLILSQKHETPYPPVYVTMVTMVQSSLDLRCLMFLSWPLFLWNTVMDDVIDTSHHVFLLSCKNCYWTAKPKIKHKKKSNEKVCLF